MELLSDGVIELVPLRHLSHAEKEKAQGMLRVHGLPVFHEKGGGLEGGWIKQDMSFKLSASSGLIITPYSLPPVGEGGDIQTPGTPTSGVDAPKSASLEF
ncbi:paxneb protein [Purpureocillium lavendulum]|uniref:Paxneb protein n=1 Tax=Purpureocillium lavendulum TaxID=1247861 RepID=A0AB34FWG4_9HYPO|nr:paxneb protein [Purpureocillium lavendulum]